ALRRIDGSSALIGRLHESWTTAGDDVAAQVGRARRHALDLVVDERPRPRPRGTEDRYPIALTLGGTQPREVVDNIPQTEDGLGEVLLDGLFVRQADRACLALGSGGAHCMCLQGLE